MSLAICGLATARPPQAIDQRAAAEIAQTFLRGERDARGLSVLFRRTQVRIRRSVLLEPPGTTPRQSFYWPASGPQDHGPTTAVRMQRYAEESLPLAGAAAEQALVNAAIPPMAVTHLVTVSCTGFFAPGLDIGLIKRLGLPPTVGRLHVGFMGCHGTLNALRAAQAWVDADPAAVVLVCAVELCSLHFQYGCDPDTLVANALFADGAAALVGRSATSGDEAWRMVAAGSNLMPDAEDGMTWRIGNHGFQMTLSPRVPDLIGAHLRPWLKAWLASLGRRLEDLNSWAVHPGGPRILSSVAKSLGLSEATLATSAEILAECGNMSSPTVLFILQRLQQQGARRPCLALGFGPGLVAEAALLE